MPLRPGEEPKLAADEEAALLLKLRLEREAKAAALLQLEVQNLSAKMIEMDLASVPAEAKRLCKTEKLLAPAPSDAQIALMLNAIMRSCCPPVKEEKKGGGGKKGANAVKAATAKIAEGEPPPGAAVRKALKANKHLLTEVAKGKGAAGQLALLNALQAWVLSPQGANALAHSAKIIEVLYDIDQAEEGSLKTYWAALDAQRAREAAELEAAEEKEKTTSAEVAQGEDAVKAAEKEKADAAWYLKQAEQLAQARRCGGNPNKDEEAAEKAAQQNLKKCIDFHTQTNKILAARSKDLVEARAEDDPTKRLVAELRHRRDVGVVLFMKHATPFFEWLDAEDDDDDDDEAGS